MLDNNLFSPEKIMLTEFKLLREQLNVPEFFDSASSTGFHIDNSLQLGFSLADKLVKVDFSIEIKTASKGRLTEEAVASFLFVFIYTIDNLEELAKPDKKKIIAIDPELGNALSSITYSTARGILLMRLQGTALQHFVLPVINPNTLWVNK